MKKLIVSGCSFTDADFHSLFHPELDCSWPKWPELLAEKLNMECINLGLSGRGNEYIYSSILDTIFDMDPNDIGLVIAAWSEPHRDDFQKKTRWLTSSYRHPNNLFNKWDWGNGDISYYMNKSLQYYFNLQTICKQYNIICKQFQMLTGIFDYLYSEILFEQTKLDILPAPGQDIWPGISGTSEATKAAFHARQIVQLETIKEMCQNKANQNIYNKRKREMLYWFQDNALFQHIEENQFIGWPLFSELGGYNIANKIIPNDDLNSYLVSTEDRHPNAIGHKRIAEFVHENL